VCKIIINYYFYYLTALGEQVVLSFSKEIHHGEDMFTTYTEREGIGTVSMCQSVSGACGLHVSARLFLKPRIYLIVI